MQAKSIFQEKHIEHAIQDLLALDGWHVFKMEQNFSEKKMRSVLEPGMPDLLAIRYCYVPDALTPGTPVSRVRADVLWIEVKILKGRIAPHQHAWREAERARGALTLIAGVDFHASIEGFMRFYQASGLQRRKLRLQGERAMA